MSRRLGILLSSLLLYLSLWQGEATAKKDQPGIEETQFENLPKNLFYFEDTDVVFVTDEVSRTIYRSEDAGVIWTPLKGVPKGEAFELFKHPYDNKVAVAIGTETTHWISKDQGKSWDEFTTEYKSTRSRAPLSFHATDPDRILFLAHDSSSWRGEDKVYYTTDGFASSPTLLHEDAVSCLWAKSTDLFKTGDSAADLDKTLCIIRGDSVFSSGYRLVVSDDFFKTRGVEPKMDDDRPVQGVINIAAVKSYVVAAAKSEGTSELAMYVTDNAVTWHRAEFGEHTLNEDAYTLLESTNYSMQVDVMTTKPTSPMGVLFTSNSNGTFFTKSIEHTNRNYNGFVDFEKIQNIQGIVMVNVVENWEEVENSWLIEKKKTTKISFDDGRTWQAMMTDNGKELHLHSVTDQRNTGRIFSSPAPGIVMGVGNTGDYLGDTDEGDTYVSDDAGLTWTRALRKPHLYEFGDQGAIIVAIEDGETDEIKWSINHGKDWEKMELKDKVKPLQLTTAPDSTTLRFILAATKGRGSRLEYFIYSLDFDGLHEKTCKRGDFEEWAARVDEDGKPSCIMGHTQTYRRRKADVNCFIGDDFKDPEPIFTDCKCTNADYECDYNFVRSEDGKSCVPTAPLKAPEGACASDDDNFMGSSGHRLIPGNTCVKRGGVVNDEPKEWPCGDTKHPPASGQITSEVTTFKGSSFIEYYYLERAETSQGEDETIVMRTDRRETYLTDDHGKTWRPAIEQNDEIVAIYPHQYFNDRVYMVTAGRTVYYSENRGKTVNTFEAPDAPNMEHLQILSFHPAEKDWLIWTGGKDCNKGDCHTVAHVSTKGGEDWTTLLRYIRKCQFVYRENREKSDQRVYCEQYENEDEEAKLQLVASDDWFKHKTVHFDDVINFATMQEFIVVAIRDEDQTSLRVDTSIDGATFANAQFPANFQVPHQQAYTVLDSSTHAVFLHVTVNNRQDQEYGSIVKSNSNGTSYVLSINEVNRNGPGYVDFEKMQGLEGVAIVNVVANKADADSGSIKKLKTMITHNDGAEWGYIARPEDPEHGDAFGCKDGVLEKCSLHLHGYTERKDPRDTFSSPSAVGLMIGVGNVGEYLGAYNEGDTFITRDGGISWHLVAPGTWMWEYGDQGSIIAIVKEGEPTREVMYSLNEGADWKPYEFSPKDMVVDDITTVPSDTSRNFLLWGKIGKEIVTVNIDFSGLTENRCTLGEDDPDGPHSDFYSWAPKHPLSTDDCLFGHIAQYHRKKTDRDCYIGRREIQHSHTQLQNCSCTRQDFECDYNYERQNDGSCSLVEGLEAADPKAVCTKNDVFEYYDPTGYRRIPLTTCTGGKELDFSSASRPCPGKEPDYQRAHGISGAGLFFAIVLPIAAAAAVGWWVWRNWEGKFGRIQLGDGTMGGGFDRDSPWIKWPVAAVSAVVAVLAALPVVVMTVWRTLSTRFGRSGGAYSRPYTSRSSFQRGRGDYAAVDPEGELLGEDSEDEV